VNFIHKNARSTTGSTFNYIDITGESRRTASIRIALNPDRITCAFRDSLENASSELDRAEFRPIDTIQKRIERARTRERDDVTLPTKLSLPWTGKMQMRNYIRLVDVLENYIGGIAQLGARPVILSLI
jgi:hypothetical protein